MAKAFNKVFLMGRLTRDIEIKTTGTGKTVGSFTVASDKASGEGADFFDCVAWEKTADLMSQYTGKGSKVLVEGNLQQQTWEKDGQKRSKVEIVVRDVTFLDSKADSNAKPAEPTADVVIDDIGDEPIDLSDIPF